MNTTLLRHNAMEITFQICIFEETLQSPPLSISQIINHKVTTIILPSCHSPSSSSSDWSESTLSNLVYVLSGSNTTTLPPAFTFVFLPTTPPFI